jgi:hypothetical protein
LSISSVTKLETKAKNPRQTEMKKPRFLHASRALALVVQSLREVRRGQGMARHLLVWILALWQAGVGSPAGTRGGRHLARRAPPVVARACRPTVPEDARVRRVAALAAMVDRLRGGGAAGTTTGTTGSGVGARELLDDGSDGDGSSYAPSSGQALDAASVLAEWDDRYVCTPEGGAAAVAVAVAVPPQNFLCMDGHGCNLDAPSVARAQASCVRRLPVRRLTRPWNPTL